MPLDIHHIHAKKSLGQNFLIDPEALHDISHSIEVSGKHIIEVGPGYGALTECILPQNPSSLDMIELDTDMIHILEQRIESEWRKDIPCRLHHTDVLKYLPENREYSVIANIPYYITSPILFHFLYDIEYSPKEMVILMQKEVGEKIVPKNGKKVDNSFFSLCMQYRCEKIEIIRIVKNTAFNPPPKVDSIVLLFQVKEGRDTAKEKMLIDFWKYAFRFPRKLLTTNLRGYHGDMENK